CSMNGSVSARQPTAFPAGLPGPAVVQPDAGNAWFVSWKLCRARPICLRLFWQLIRAAASRTFCTAGSSRLMRTAMMGMTTSNSISVKPGRADLRRGTGHLRQGGGRLQFRKLRLDPPARRVRQRWALLSGAAGGLRLQDVLEEQVDLLV